VVSAWPRRLRLSMLRGKRDDYRRKALNTLALAVALIATPLQIISGDFNARFLVTAAQPAKLAAMEGGVSRPQVSCLSRNRWYPRPGQRVRTT